jgi:hypothetical protein
MGVNKVRGLKVITLVGERQVRCGVVFRWSERRRLCLRNHYGIYP